MRRLRHHQPRVSGSFLLEHLISFGRADRMIRYSWKILPLIIFISIFAGCRSHVPSGQGVILFSVVGNQPFSDWVSTINVDGSRHRRLLIPSRAESYLYASGYSSKGPLLVVTHKEIPNNRVEDRLSIYSPPTGNWAAIQTAEGSVGRGVLSPDGSTIVFAFAPGREAYYKLYIKRSPGDQPVRLTSSHEENETEGYASWRQDGQEVVFVTLAASAGHLVSKLLRVPVTGGEPTLVLADDNPGGAIYSPSGQTLFVLTKRGIEELGLDGTNRRLLFEWRQLPYEGFRYGCITWCTGTDLIAFATMNKKKESEIWTVSLDGQKPRKIYATKDGSIEGLFFLNN